MGKKILAVGCLSKQGYVTKADAETAGRLTRRTALRAYRCRYCQRYHLGHKAVQGRR